MDFVRADVGGIFGKDGIILKNIDSEIIYPTILPDLSEIIKRLLFPLSS